MMIFPPEKCAPNPSGCFEAGMMKKMQFAFGIALFLSISFLFFLSGCTSSEYVPCCARNGFFDANGTAIASPSCTLSNGTPFGGCTLISDLTASCSDGTQCSAIANEDKCALTENCVWDDASTPKCTGPSANWVMGICADRVPSSCVKDKCSAMVCGYSSLRPAPPPASRDWDANKSMNGQTISVMPVNEIITPSTGLQGATCEYDTMNKKLVNKLQASRGALWINSFRFGVGNSFADFEAARNFFPSTDKVCAINPDANVDRFTVYLNMIGKFCHPITSYYQCTGKSLTSGLSFSDVSTCNIACGGATSCESASGNKFMCNVDKFVYDTNSECARKCSMVDTRACANDVASFPFLSTDATGNANYRMRYVADYMVDTRNYDILKGYDACESYGGPYGLIYFPYWSIKDWSKDLNAEQRVACDDFAHDWPKPYKWVDGPWWYTYNDSSNALGELRTYFDNHAYGTVDFDYGFYAKELIGQYAPGDPRVATQLPFECNSSAECMSGTCDTTYYKRSMCMQGNQPLWCGCTTKIAPDKMSYPSCQLSDNLANLPMYANTGVPEAHIQIPIPEQPGEYSTLPLANPINNYGSLFAPEDSVHDGDGKATLHFIYYFPVSSGSPDEPQPALFGMCQFSPAESSPVKMCIMQNIYDIVSDYIDPITQDYIRTPQFTDYVIWEPDEFDGNCYYSNGELATDEPKYYWKYDINLAAGSLGVCNLNGGSGGQPLPKPPYLAISDLGWCAPCTYATLAVQKVDWNLSNPGGAGNPRNFSCYEYRADFNYIPNQTIYGGIPGSPNDTSIGIARTDVRMASPSTEPVRKSSNPSAYEQDYNGNIVMDYTTSGEMNTYWCMDEWNGAGGWWKPSEIPTPSAPYLKDKLTSYLQSNIMPILDEINEKTIAASMASCTGGGYKTIYVCNSPSSNYTSMDSCMRNCGAACIEDPDASTYFYVCSSNGRAYANDKATCNAGCAISAQSKNYPPLSICNDMGGDGAVIHAVGNSSMLSTIPSLVDDYGSIMPAGLNQDLIRYMGITSNSLQTFTVSKNKSGKNAILARTYLLKNLCKTPPLVGIEIMPDETETTLIGSPGCDLSDINATCRGKLHTFFYDSSQNGALYYPRVTRAIPDEFPDGVDMFLQDWYPMCNQYGSSGEAEAYEIERRLDFSRALLSNFSKTSLIWKFAFPASSNCNKSFFLGYLFNNTAAMVKAGITGIIYSDWMMKDGLGSGPEKTDYQDIANYGALRVHDFAGTLNTGLTQQLPSTRGASSTQTFTLAGPTGAKSEVFCALEKESVKAIGYIRLTYGQKLYASTQTCMCEECTAYDYRMGICDYSGSGDQLYCNDGQQCTMPAGSGGSNYRCAYRCMNYSACELCSENTADASFCRISDADSTFGISRAYNKFSDNYWEFLAGLPASEKCCLNSSFNGESGAKYTFVSVSSTMRNAKPLQYPSRGATDVICEGAPDTSVLSYCNVLIPLAEKELACMRITPTNIDEDISIGAE